jgi:hypothetical protein
MNFLFQITPSGQIFSQQLLLRLNFAKCLQGYWAKKITSYLASRIWDRFSNEYAYGRNKLNEPVEFKNS